MLFMILYQKWTFQFSKILMICYCLSEILNLIGITNISEIAITTLCSTVFMIELARYSVIMVLAERDTFFTNLNFIILVIAPLFGMVILVKLEPFVMEEMITVGYKVLNLLLLLGMFFYKKKWRKIVDNKK